jgi:hypothetical protein
MITLILKNQDSHYLKVFWRELSNDKSGDI